MKKALIVMLAATLSGYAFGQDAKDRSQPTSAAVQMSEAEMAKVVAGDSNDLKVNLVNDHGTVTVGDHTTANNVRQRDGQTGQNVFLNF
jgi:hypothetical protein